MWKTAFKNLKWYGLPKQTISFQFFFNFVSHMVVLLSIWFLRMCFYRICGFKDSKHFHPYSTMVSARKTDHFEKRCPPKYSEYGPGCASCFVHLSVSFSLTFHFHFKCNIAFTLKVNIVLSVIFLWLVGSQSQSNYCRWFGFVLLVLWYVSFSVFLSVFL